MNNINNRGIYTDLVRELSQNGINMYVVTPREKRSKLPTEVEVQNDVKFLRVRIGNIRNVGLIEKGISTITIEKKYKKNILKYFKNVKFDMVMYSTPPITFEKLVQFFKDKQKSKTYLILKDIFPQNAIDINLMKKESFLWKYFRKREMKLYEMSDVIGCMSQANIEYIHKHNNVPLEKLEIFPNSIKPLDIQSENIDSSNVEALRSNFGISSDSTLFVYGGNLGKPQGIDFLLEVIREFKEIEKSHLLIVGSGTEFKRIQDFIKENKPRNVNLFNRLPKNDYDNLLDIADVGLIFLDRRFTIPNFPSRLTAYMEKSIPVLAATDTNTDLKEVLNNSDSGLWCESGDLEGFIQKAKQLSSDKHRRKVMGKNGRNYLEKNYDISKTVQIILKHL